MAHIRAGDQYSTDYIANLITELSSKGWYHSIELPDGSVIPGLLTLEQLRNNLAQYPVPDDLRGKRVLDIGAWDGWYSFEMERRGAEVVSVDVVELDTFRTARELRGSKIEFVLSDIYHLTPERLGRFDIVLCLGVLYHLKHPLLGLERVCALSKDLAFIESFVLDDGVDLDAPPVMEFYETEELLGRFDNWSACNTSCLLAFCRTAGFASAQLTSVLDQRAHVVCRRHWPTPPAAPKWAAPEITGIVNDRTGDATFHSSVDEYLSIFFKSDQPSLGRAEVMPEIGGYGVLPMHVSQSRDSGWQLACKVPPGAEPGLHGIRLRTSESDFSDTVQVMVDGAASATGGVAEASQPEIASVADARTWEVDRVHSGDDPCVALWVRGLPVAAARRHLRASIAGREAAVLFLSLPDVNGACQVNVRVPEGLVPGDYGVEISYGAASSQPAALRVIAPEN